MSNCFDGIPLADAIKEFHISPEWQGRITRGFRGCFQPAKIQLWIDVLRSGKYEQSELFLNEADTHFCAFGVLCEQLPTLLQKSNKAVETSAIPYWSRKPETITVLGYKDTGWFDDSGYCYTAPPMSLLFWLANVEPLLKTTYAIQRLEPALLLSRILMQANDKPDREQAWSFNKIADFLEMYCLDSPTPTA